jgi:hypothetical protein
VGAPKHRAPPCPPRAAHNANKTTGFDAREP